MGKGAKNVSSFPGVGNPPKENPRRLPSLNFLASQQVRETFVFLSKTSKPIILLARHCFLYPSIYSG